MSSVKYDKKQFPSSYKPSKPALLPGAHKYTSCVEDCDSKSNFTAFWCKFICHCL